MKKFFVACIPLLLFFFFPLSGQNIHVRPGKSAGEIRLGMKLREATGILGDGFEVKDFAREKEAFSGQYDPATLLQFKLGFDSCVVYNEFPKYPFFKLYFKNDRLNYIILTSYGANEKLIRRYKLPKKVRFGAKKETVLRKYRPPDETVTADGYDGDFIWLKKGMEIIFDKETGLAVVFLFSPIP